MARTIKALRSKGARELVIITAADFRWLLALARKHEEITVDASGAQMQAMGGVGGDTIHVTLPRGVGEWMGLVYDEKSGNESF